MSPMKSNVLFIVIFFFMSLSVQSQSLLDAVRAQQDSVSFKTSATFKGNYISLGQSVETREQGVLEISWMNRFWNRPIPSSQSFVADKWNARLGVTYGITDKLTTGVAWTSGYRSADAFLKYRLLQQTVNNKTPLSITLFQNAVFREKEPTLDGLDIQTTDKLAFTSQLLIARKINTNFSLQISPTFVHREADLVLEEDEANHIALGIGGRYRIGNHVSVVSEYYLIRDAISSVKTYSPFSLGVNWEVADLLLQFKLTNANNLVEDKFIIKTFNNFNFRDGNLHFGFHATYAIHLSKKRTL